MVMAARRAYADAARWMASARPRRMDPWRLTRSLFRTCFIGSLLLLGAIGLLRPQQFGSPTSQPRGGLGWWMVAAVVALCALWALTRWSSIRSTTTWLLEPYRRPLDHLEAFEPTVSALDSCPAALRTRFAWAWVWGPAAAVVAGAFFAASAAYFIIDALLAEFQIGAQQPLLAGINVVLSLLALRLAARKLATWRLAASVHRWISGGYAA